MAGTPSNDLNISQAGYVVFDGVSTFTGRTFQAGTGITLTNGSGISGNTTISLTGGGTAAEFITGDSGGQLTPSANNFNLLGSGSITTSGSGSTLTTQLTGLTNHALLVGAGTTTISKVGPTSTSGQILQSAGSSADPAFSTATYPATATGTGKILRADGTNWSATTATFPDTAGTSTNVLTSDGTNWSSSAAPKSFSFNLYTTSSAPADATTYYMQNTLLFTSVTTSNLAILRYYFPFACTINNVFGTFRIAGTFGSNENSTIFLRINDTTNVNVLTNVQLTATDNPFSKTALGLAVNAGDFAVVGFTGATWATNPNSMSFCITVST